MVNKGPFMEFMEVELIHDGGNVADTITIYTPSSKTEKMACLIHMIQIDVQQPSFSAGVWEYIEAVFSKTSHEGDNVLPDIGDSDILHRVKEWAQEGIIAGTWTRWREGESVVYFDPPILYPKDVIYFEVEMSDNQVTGKVCSGRIGYTLEKVTDESFIAALVE